MSRVSKYNVIAKGLVSPSTKVSPEESQLAYLNILEDMQADKQAIDDQRKATFNILEDITYAQEELQARLLQVDTLRQTLENLSRSLEPKNVMETVMESITKLVPYYSLSYIIAQGQDEGTGNTVYINAKGPLGRVYITKVQQDFLAFVKNMPSGIINGQVFVRQLHKKIYPEFLSGSYDEERGLRSASSFVVPLKTRSPDQSGDYILGLFHIASINPKETLTNYQIEILYDIANVSALNMERIRSIAATEQARLTSLLRSMSNGVVLFDTSKNIILLNPSAGRMLGFPEQDPIKHLSHNIGFKELQKILGKGKFDLSTKMKMLLEQGEEFHIEEFNLMRFTYEIYLVPVRNVADSIIGGALIMHDVTHIREIDRMKTEFVSVASHQLRTPLTAIKLFIEMLASEEVGKLNTKQKDYMLTLGHSTERMIMLVNDLLNVSRLETGRLKVEPKLVQIEDFIQSIIDEADPIAKGKKCRIVFKHPKQKLPKILIDISLLRQVVHNLVINAIRYSPTRQCDIVIQLEQVNHDYQICVSDKGIGIAKENQPRIFEKFFRTDRARKVEAEGSGLGMYVAKMIMQACGGKIWFESKGSAKGTKFYITIPAQGMAKKEGEKGLIPK